MKDLKLFFLAALAAASLMACVGAGTASAETQTVLCKSTDVPHCMSYYGTGTKVVAHAIEGTDIKNLTVTAAGIFSELHCNSTLTSNIEQDITPSGKFDTTWWECDSAITIAPRTSGTLAVHHDAEHNGAVTFEGFVTKFSTEMGIDCYYGGTIEGTVTASTATTGAALHITQNVPKVDTPIHDSSFWCPSQTTWHATYEITEPYPLYVGTRESTG